jgi:hypothetical protein
MFRRKTPEERREAQYGETISIVVDGQTISGRMRVTRLGLWPMPRFIRRWVGFPD